MKYISICCCLNSCGQPPEEDDVVLDLKFHCQLAHGSPTGIISGFSNVKDLYQKIAACYDMEASQILFCTLNTHEVDMGHLLGGLVGLDDFIFAHCKESAQEIVIKKTKESLGLTMTDNGAGNNFIKRIKENSVVSNIPIIEIGDYIEKINGESLAGYGHHEVSEMLKKIPEDTTLCLVKTQKAAYKEENSGKENLPVAQAENGPDGEEGLKFHCQLAHGSSTGVISGFSNVKELYQKIAAGYGIEASNILFCTRNTHRIDMGHVLGEGTNGQSDDFFFAHCKGSTNEIVLKKSQNSLGLTMSDNGAGNNFIAGIEENSVVSNIPSIEIGDHIEKINGQSLTGFHQEEVVKILETLPNDTDFTICLVKPKSYNRLGNS